MKKYFFGLSIIFFANCCFSQSLQNNIDTNFNTQNNVEPNTTFSTTISTQSQSSNLNLTIINPDGNNYNSPQVQEPLILESNALANPTTISKNSFSVIPLTIENKSTNYKKEHPTNDFITISESETAIPIETYKSNFPIKTTLIPKY